MSRHQRLTIDILRADLAAERARVDTLLDRLAARNLAEFHAVQTTPESLEDEAAELRHVYDDTGLIQVSEPAG